MQEDRNAGRRRAAPGPRIEVRLHARVALRYHALALVPLPGDDAELHRPAYAAGWREALASAGVAPAELQRRIEAAHAALARGSDRLRWQVDVLANPGADFPDGPVGQLERLLASAHDEAWSAAADATEACRARFAGLLARLGNLFRPLCLTGLRRLVAYLCPALADAGRATRAGDRYLVAVGLPEDEAGDRATLLQLLHECCHPLSDDLAGEAGAGFDTDRAAAAHAAHRLREDAALALGAHWLGADPDLQAAYFRWAARYRKPERLAGRLLGALDLPEARRAALLERAAEVVRIARG